MQHLAVLGTGATTASTVTLRAVRNSSNEQAHCSLKAVKSRLRPSGMSMEASIKESAISVCLPPKEGQEQLVKMSSICNIIQQAKQLLICSCDSDAVTRKAERGKSSSSALWQELGS